MPPRLSVKFNKCRSNGLNATPNPFYCPFSFHSSPVRARDFSTSFSKNSSSNRNTHNSKSNNNKSKSKSNPTTTTPTIPPTLRSLNRLATSSSAPLSRTTAPAAPTYTQQEYRRAARRWTTLIVSLPVVLVSSWWLYERVVLGKEQRRGLFESPQAVGYIGRDSRVEGLWEGRNGGGDEAGEGGGGAGDGSGKVVRKGS